MKWKARLHAALGALTVVAMVIAFASTVSAYVTTDQFDYPPGSTVTFSGDNSDEAGYLAGETVIVDVSGPNGYVSSCVAVTNFDGAWSCQVTLPTQDAVGTYLYTATGENSGVSQSGVFTDATLTLFEDAGFTIQRNAFAWGATLHARGTESTTFANRCFRLEIFDPSSTLVDTQFQLANGSGTTAFSFAVPATGPSGIWSATLRRSSAISNCSAADYSNATGQSIQIFDVARAVIVGAGSPAADSPGGDNFVSQSVPSTVQGVPAGLGTRLQVVSRSSLNQRSFLRFDVAGAGLPSGAEITDARLRLWTTKFPTAPIANCPVPRTYEAQPAGASWSEGTITWNNQPGVVGSASLVSIPASLSSLYVRFGITDQVIRDHVQDFVDNPSANHGWRVKDQTENAPTVNCDANFASTEAEGTGTRKDQWPVLLIDYELAPPPLVTNGSLCTFDVNETRNGSQFRLIFTPDQPNSTSTDPRWKLNASNPGQFSFNVFVTGTPGTEETVTLTLPYPFVTKGANPVHAFDGVTFVENGATCLIPGAPVEVTADPPTVALSDYTGDTINVAVTFTFPASGFVYIATHLDYGLKHVSAKCKPDNKIDVNVTCELPESEDIDNHAPYTFSFSNSQSGSATVENENVVKNDPGVAGLVTRTGSGDPVAGVTVEIYDSKGIKRATVYSDADGWYQWTYKHTGKAETFLVKLPGYGVQKSATLKSNAYVIVNFEVQ